MRSKLNAFDNVAGGYSSTKVAGTSIGNENFRFAMFRAEPTVRQILKALDTSLADRLNLDAPAGEETARNLVHQAIGMLDDMDEWDANLTPDAPTLPADQLHRWVWDAARTYWESKHYRAAVNAAATAINAHTQTKIDRRDLFDRDLMNQAFPSSPRSDQVYLRLPGDMEDRTVKSRNQALRPYAEGCFAGIRNPATHEHGADWDEQTALERLAALSVLARWIEECEVVVEPS